jgi:CRISPR-associated endonuclease/helicase Cas3
MLFFRYRGHDQRNLFDDALKTFWYVVIDEFHYYDEKQLVSFLAFLTLWQEWKFFDEGRKVCLLSATPNPQIEAYLTSILGPDWKQVTPQDSVESDLTETGTSVFTGRYDQIHTPTDAPGVGSMPQLRL